LPLDDSLMMLDGSARRLQLSGWFPWLVWWCHVMPWPGWPLTCSGSQGPVATLPRRPPMRPWFWCWESRVLASQQLPQLRTLDFRLQGETVQTVQPVLNQFSSPLLERGGT
jgi:hypothetical protein